MLVLAAGCSHAPYVWVDELAESRGPEVSTIAPGDLLYVRVYNQEPMSVRARVRPDGRIAMPLVGDVEVRGKAPAALSAELGARLKEFVVAPFVTVTIEEARPNNVAVLGEVAHPGVYGLDPSAGVLTALAAAGGLTDFASHDRIFVVRRSTGQRIRFSLVSLGEGRGRASAFRVEPGDAIEVE